MAAIPVYESSKRPPKGAPPIRVTPVTSGIVQGGKPIPVINITDDDIANGWPAPVSNWPISVYVVTNSGQPVVGDNPLPVYGLSTPPSPPVPPTPPTYPERVLAYNPIGFWPLNEVVGETTALCLVDPLQNGVYSANDIAGQTVWDDPDYSAPTFVKATVDRVTLPFAELTEFNPALGWLSCWIKVNSWTPIGFGWVLMFYGNASNYVQVRQSSVANRLDVTYTMGGTNKEFTMTGLITTEWFHVGATWSLADDQFRCYLNGVEQLPIKTGLGTWNTGALTRAMIASQTIAGANTFEGNVAMVALGADAVLTPEEMADLADSSTPAAEWFISP